MRPVHSSGRPGGCLHQALPPGPDLPHPPWSRPPQSSIPPGADPLGPDSPGADTPPRVDTLPPGADTHPLLTEWQTPVKI